jgi:hypothetical protein
MPMPHVTAGAFSLDKGTKLLDRALASWFESRPIISTLRCR